MIFNPNVMAAAGGGGGAIVGTPATERTNLIIDIGVELAAVIVADTQGSRAYLAISGASKAITIPGYSSVPLGSVAVSWSGTAVTISTGLSVTSFDWTFVAFPKS